MKQLKGDNRGLSLIEVLVAVAILAIVVTPFLHSFVTAANANSKAKEIHKATVVAQSVMEGMKAETIRDIAMQFNYPDQGFYIIPVGQIGDGTDVASRVEELRYNSATGLYDDVLKYEDPALDGAADRRGSVTASIVSEDVGLTGDFKQQTDGMYYFALEAVKEDKSTYDVLVRLNAAAYRAGTGGAVDDAHRYNSMEMTQLPVLDLDRDAMCIQKQDYTEMAVDHFQASFPDKTEAEILADLNRTITISVDRILAGASYDTTVTVSYEYTYQSGGALPLPYVKEQKVFDNNETGEELRSVYLYYYPLYLENAGDPAREEIIFENDKQYPVNFYLMKQEDTDNSDGVVATESSESTYKMILSFKETGSTQTTMKTKLYTNLGRNLVNGLDIAPLLHTVKLNNGTISLDAITEDNILNAENQDRMYVIDVSVYEAGAKTAGFPEEKRLTTLEGSSVY